MSERKRFCIFKGGSACNTAKLVLLRDKINYHIPTSIHGFVQLLPYAVAFFRIFNNIGLGRLVHARRVLAFMLANFRLMIIDQCQPSQLSCSWGCTRPPLCTTWLASRLSWLTSLVSIRPGYLWFGKKRIATVIPWALSSNPETPWCDFFHIMYCGGTT